MTQYIKYSCARENYKTKIADRSKIVELCMAGK